MPDTPSQLRSAIERGDFAQARKLWEDWSAELTRRHAAGTLEQAEWPRIQELYRWSQGVLVAERAHLLQRLNTVHAASAYGPAAALSQPTFVQGRF